MVEYLEANSSTLWLYNNQTVKKNLDSEPTLRSQTVDSKPKDVTKTFQATRPTQPAPSQATAKKQNKQTPTHQILMSYADTRRLAHGNQSEVARSVGVDDAILQHFKSPSPAFRFGCPSRLEKHGRRTRFQNSRQPGGCIPRGEPLQSRTHTSTHPPTTSRRWRRQTINLSLCLKESSLKKNR